MKAVNKQLALLDPTPMEEAFGEIDDGALDTYRLFIRTTEPMMADIQFHLQKHELEAAAESAHSAKGAARMTGAFQLAAVFAEIERCCKENSLGDALDWMIPMSDAFAAVRQAIETVETTGAFPHNGD